MQKRRRVKKSGGQTSLPFPSLLFPPIYSFSLSLPFSSPSSPFPPIPPSLPSPPLP